METVYVTHQCFLPLVDFGQCREPTNGLGGLSLHHSQTPTLGLHLGAKLAKGRTVCQCYSGAAKISDQI